MYYIIIYPYALYYNKIESFTINFYDICQMSMYENIRITSYGSIEPSYFIASHRYSEFKLYLIQIQINWRIVKILDMKKLFSF